MRGDKLAVMLIDDNRIDLFVHQMHITQMNFTRVITEFLHASDAISYLEVNEKADWPDLILLDIHMPEFNGFDFLDRFSKFPEELRQKCKIIIVSSSLDEGDKSKVNNNELVLRLFEKPLNTERLRVLLETQGII